MLIWRLHVVFHSHFDSYVRTAHMHEETPWRRRLQDETWTACEQTDMLHLLLETLVMILTGWRFCLTADPKKIKSPIIQKEAKSTNIQCVKNISKSKTKIYFAGERTVWQPWTACRRCVFPLGPLSPSSSCSSSLTQCRWPLFFPCLCLFFFVFFPFLRLCPVVCFPVFFPFLFLCLPPHHVLPLLLNTSLFSFVCLALLFPCNVSTHYFMHLK